MPTIENPPRPRQSDAHTGRPSRMRRPGIGWCVPLLLVGALFARHVTSDPTARSGANGHTAEASVVRVWGEQSVRTPAAWVRLAGARGFITWGAADRSHTVTIASTEASVLPLAGVVREVTREASRTLPGARSVGGPTPVRLEGPVPHGDSAILARFDVRGKDRPTLHVVQVWRRDSRGERDLVATWTSLDGKWPVDPARAAPEPA